MDESIVKSLVDETGQVLLDAADYIERHGWCQYIVEDNQGRVCIGGAISAAASNSDQDDLYVYALVRLDKYLHSYKLVPFWNDTPGRTKEEVIAALRAAAYTR